MAAYTDTDVTRMLNNRQKKKEEEKPEKSVKTAKQHKTEPITRKTRKPLRWKAKENKELSEG